MKEQYKSAKASYENETLVVSTGRMTRTWQVTDAGLKTVCVRDETSGTQWQMMQTAPACDWEVPGVDESGHCNCRIESVQMREDDDEGFTSPHLAVDMGLYYPGTAMRLRYAIWAWPDAPGIRTQHWIRPGVTGRTRYLQSTGMAESLAVNMEDAKLQAAGYYNHTQGRNKPGDDLLKEWKSEAAINDVLTVDWASLASVIGDQAALTIVKESHKCVNQTGCDTGEFRFDPCRGLVSTGWGVAGACLNPLEYHPAWAHWCVLSEPEDFAIQNAVKTIDRLRFATDIERDMYIISNTWGSRGAPKGLSSENYGRGSRDAAKEDNVLREIEAAADLGVDIVQIDDGWQEAEDDCGGWIPSHDNGWHPHPTMYPEGWKTVREAAKAKDVKLGLWGAAQWISLDEMLENYREGGFVQWKLDFADLPEYALVRELVKKMRHFTLETNHQVRMNLDVTENPPRFGYYFGREFGCCYLENRKPSYPEKVVYVPHLVLRDLWQLSHYCNLQRFQGTIQNVRMCNPDRSDAHEHSQEYAVAIALASTPLFFMELQTFEQPEREAIKPLLAAYRKHRRYIYDCTVHPIGRQPDNSQWTGFQLINHESAWGYLLLFREIKNQQSKALIAFHQITGSLLRITDCLSGDSNDIVLADGKQIEWEIDKTPGFSFLRYEIL